MPEYTVHVTTTYKVEADSPQEAMQLMHDGDGPRSDDFEDIWFTEVYEGEKCVWDWMAETRKKYGLYLGVKNGTWIP